MSRGSKSGVHVRNDERLHANTTTKVTIDKNTNQDSVGENIKQRRYKRENGGNINFEFLGEGSS